MRGLLSSLFLGATALTLSQAPAGAQPINPAATAPDLGMFSVLSKEEREEYSAIFAAIDAQHWDRFNELIAQADEDALKGFALAEYYTHANSPRIELPAIEAWLERYPYLPQAEQLVRLGARRGLEQAPDLPRANSFTRQRSITKRMRPRGTNDGTMPSEIATGITSAIRDDDPDSARLLLDGIDANLSSAARAEWRQKVAWSYYIENRDTAALAMARRVPEDGSGPWVAEGYFTEGLAAWRLGDCNEALYGFGRSAAMTSDRELQTAAHYWAGRSATRCRKPENAVLHWQRAARDDETLYGMLAREQLGMPLPDKHTVTPLSSRDWRELRRQPNIELTAALMELGQDELADEALRHQVRIGSVRDFAQYAQLARQLGLARTQVWMGHNVPRGATPDPSLRFPTVQWRPYEGWRVDPALAFAHALQESDFRHRAVSPANAVGLMQVRPIAARDVDDRTELDARFADLKDPATNLSFGQANLQKLSQSRTTGGQLPKVMAAYNAGTSPVARWNSEVRDGGDPLLWMESIPYWETRSYVSIVMRNYWIYLRQQDAPHPSRSALAQNQWPEFPQGRR